MKKFITILLFVILLAGCNIDEPCETQTIILPAEIDYSIINMDREVFSGSPDVWAAKIIVLDSNNVQMNFLLTEVEYKILVDRHYRNLTDIIKK